MKIKHWQLVAVILMIYDAVAVTLAFFGENESLMMLMLELINIHNCY